MALDPVFLQLVRGLTTAQTPEARGLVDTMAHEIQKIEPYVGAGVQELYNLFYKGTVPNDNQPLRTTLRGMRPVYFPYEPKQGDHLLTRYHPHTPKFMWETKCKFMIRTSVSTNILDIQKFNTIEQLREAVNNDLLSFAEAPLYFWGWMIMSILVKDDDAMKKWQTGKAEGNSIWGQLLAIYKQSNGSTAGYDIMTYMNTLEGKLGIWNSSGVFQGKFPEISGTAIKTFSSGDTIGRVEKKCPLLDIIDGIRSLLFKNEVSATTSTLSFFTAAGQGNGDTAKLKGWLDGVQQVTRDMTTERYAKYMLCAGGTANQECCTAQLKALKDKGYNLGCCSQCTKAGNKCTCIPPIKVTSADLVCFIHPDTAAKFKELAPVIPHPELCQFTASNIGVSSIYELPFIEEDKIFIMHKDTLAVHGYYEGFGQADHTENYLINRWRDLGYNLGLYNLPCVVVKKPT